MKKCAVIIDNRPSKKLSKIIDNHMDYLPGWHLRHFDNIQINSPQDYNNLLTNHDFWTTLNYDKVLIFQHDSGILKEIPDGFLEFNYVGAPWKSNAPWNTKDRRGGNGGISIRDVKAHATFTQYNNYHAGLGNEDVYFSHNLFNVAPYEVCSKFGVETEFKLGTCTYHAIDKHLTVDQCNQIYNQYE